MKVKKTILLIVMITFMATIISAQENSSDLRNNIKFGLKAGANLSNVYDSKDQEFQADFKVGFAGGASPYGDLSSVTLVRERDNLVKYYYLDLTKKNIASSEYYYLLPNDVLIINPIKAKYRELRDYGLSLGATVLTSISAILSIVLITRSL